MQIVNYEERFGAYAFPEGFRAGLEGKPLCEQMKRYRVTRRSRYSMTNWGERTAQEGVYRLEDSPDVAGLIVSGSLLVGVMIRDFRGVLTPCFAEKTVCTYYAEDNNGAGYKSRQEYTYLVCVPEGFDL